MRDENLYSEALDNLVNQFTNPLIFLRELVQNSIDAGSSQIDISTHWTQDPEHPQQGIAEIRVVDHGEGMDEAIIDGQLTTMFASNKEGDLTKIGKFGIGFTSVFAIRPLAILLKTGRHGESWEIHFHADRTFDKIRSTEPFEGTSISVYVARTSESLPTLVDDCHRTLVYWCEHSSTPVSFADHTRGQTPSPAESGNEQGILDPFEISTPRTPTPSKPKLITSPMSLDSWLSQRHEADGVDVIVGYAPTPGYGFYNTGLTLVNNADPTVLGTYATRLGHLRLKVKSPYLEHTLARDNVLQDRNLDSAMARVLHAADRLRESLLVRIRESRHDHEALFRWLGLLSQEAHAGPFPEILGHAHQIWLPTMLGNTISLETALDQAEQIGSALVGSADPALPEALGARGIRVLVEHPAIRAIMTAPLREGPLARFDPYRNEDPAGSYKRISAVPADTVFLLPNLLDTENIDPTSFSLLDRTKALLVEATLTPQLELRLGEVDSSPGVIERLSAEGPPEGGLFQRNRPREGLRAKFSKKRCFLIDLRHSSWKSYRTVSLTRPDFAAAGLAHLIMSEHRLFDQADFERLHQLASEEWAQ